MKTKLVCCLVLLSVFLCQVEGKFCEYDFKENSQSNGCAQDCKVFQSYKDAYLACDADDSCKAITYAYKNNQWGYQLRNQPTSTASQGGEFSFYKIQCWNHRPYFDICDFSQKLSNYIGGCFNDCQDYSTIQEALQVCRSSQGCGGVTFSNKNGGGQKSSGALNGVFGYQLRSGNELNESNTGETSWLKQPCPKVPSHGFQMVVQKMGSGEIIGSAYPTYDIAVAACQINSNCKGVAYMVSSVNFTTSQMKATDMKYFCVTNSKQYKPLVGTETLWVKMAAANYFRVSTTPCDFAPEWGTVLGGCAQDCKDFANFDEATNACRNDNNCGGITLSIKSYGGGASKGPMGGFGFQLRSGRQLISSPVGENSWIKTTCPPLSCFYINSDGNQAGGCIGNCQNFNTFKEAKQTCDTNDGCKAITFSQGKFQMRNNQGTGPSTQETSYIKSECRNFYAFTQLKQMTKGSDSNIEFIADDISDFNQEVEIMADQPYTNLETMTAADSLPNDLTETQDQTTQTTEVFEENMVPNQTILAKNSSLKKGNQIRQHRQHQLHPNHHRQ